MPLKVLTDAVASTHDIEEVHCCHGRLRKPHGQKIVVYKTGPFMVCDEEDYKVASEDFTASFNRKVNLQELRKEYGAENVLYDTENLK